MTSDIDPKALALRVAGEIDADMNERQANSFINDDIVSRLFLARPISVSEARALAVFLREAAEGPATPDLDAVLNAAMNEMCCSGRVAVVTDAEMRAPEPAAVSPWRPIETAPRTGKDVLLCRGSMPPIVAGWYDNGEEAGWSAYDKPDVWIIGDPTHWMPLPTPPARLEDAEEPSHDRR